MSRTAKIVLIVLGVLFLLFATCVGGGLWWLSSKADEFKAGTEEIEADAKGFARLTDSQGCLDEALRLNDTVPGLMNQVKHGVFLLICLEHAEATPGFCDDVPPQTQIMASASWRVAKCQKLQAADPNSCQTLLAQVQQHCHPTTP